MSENTLDAPGVVLYKLQQIDDDLASRQNSFEEAARDWFNAKRTKEYNRARAFMKGSGTVAERNAYADEATALQGMEAEANYEALKAVVKVLETRATIAQSILKAQTRQTFGAR